MNSDNQFEYLEKMIKKPEIKILEKTGFNFDEKTLQYKENYIGKLKELNFSNDLIDKIRNLTNEQLLIFSSFFSSTLEYLYLQDNVKEKESTISSALDDVEQMISDYESGGDIEMMKSEIAKKKFKK